MTGIAIILLVKKEEHNGKAEIYYSDIGDFLDRKQKLGILINLSSFLNRDMTPVRLSPNDHGDWLTARSESFRDFTQLASADKFDEGTNSVFVTHTLGVILNRDAWVYNFSRQAVIHNMRKHVDCYNSQIGRQCIETDPRKIS